MTKPGYVYIMASARNGTLYISVTSDLVKRVWEHKTSTVEGFSKRYGVKTLVYFETFDAIEEAMKKWRRAWKLELIEKANSEWRDLYPEIVE